MPGSNIPIRSEDDLLVPFYESLRTTQAVGIECEKVGVRKDGSPITYSREVLALFDHLVTHHGWKAESEVPGGPLLSLSRGKSSVTLEPGGQFELSGAPLPDVHRVHQELVEHHEELTPPSRELGVRWLGIGFTPLAKREDLEWVPKTRYPIMREYLPTRGALALDMMLRTCTVQANLDYATEEDAMRKLRVMLKLAPITTAMFANSPFVEGARFGGVSQRAKVWLEVDPDRAGLVPPVWKDGARFEDYARWALDVPMFLFKREGRFVVNTGQTFRAFWKDGFEGERATIADWELHLATLFPEVRLKRTLEVRGADSQCITHAAALPALYVGLVYDDKALAEADALTAAWTYDEVLGLRHRVWQDGLRTPFRGAPLVEAAQRVVAIAQEGLARRKRRDLRGRDEGVHLASIASLVGRGMSPADEMLAQIDPAKPLREEILRVASIDA